MKHEVFLILHFLVILSTIILLLLARHRRGTLLVIDIIVYLLERKMTYLRFFNVVEFRIYLTVGNILNESKQATILLSLFFSRFSIG